jgi:hypothetical protein
MDSHSGAVPGVCFATELVCKWAGEDEQCVPIVYKRNIEGVMGAANIMRLMCAVAIWRFKACMFRRVGKAGWLILTKRASYHRLAALHCSPATLEPMQLQIVHALQVSSLSEEPWHRPKLDGFDLGCMRP